MVYYSYSSFSGRIEDGRIQDCRQSGHDCVFVSTIFHHVTVFHYLSLHASPFYAPRHDGRILSQSDRYSDCLVRLPMYYDLPVDSVVRTIEDYCK